MGHRLAAEIVAHIAPPRVNLKAICQEFKITLDRVWDLPIPALHENRRILYNFALDNFSIRLAIAHEMGHILLGHGVPVIDMEQKWQDQMADDFAEDLLASPLWIEKHIEVVPVSILAQVYKVGPSWLKYKLARLGLHCRIKRVEEPACSPCPLEESREAAIDAGRYSEDRQTLCQMSCPRRILCTALEKCLLPQEIRSRYLRVGKPLPCGRVYRRGQLVEWSATRSSTMPGPEDVITREATAPGHC